MTPNIDHGYAFKFDAPGTVTPSGRAEIADADAHNTAVELAEIAWLQTAPPKAMLYVKHNGTEWQVNTWLGRVLDPAAQVGERVSVGFGFHTYRRAISCRIFGTLYHGWFFESSGDYCRLRKAKRQ